MYGNLIGEFTNNESEEVTSESASLSGESIDYEGTYSSTWFDVEPHSLILNIRRNQEKYKFSWVELDRQSYEGEGILVDEMLIGHYRML
ncbi:hypothetical protein SAMN05444410_104205 [Hydrobacter penzbergensis]|uniref:Uncharacterized protein n=1 Tax=Hydrobacter penzbergensis TaxID=1235997 RepID=A0A8X8LDU1_9BACT|nr:hypothetical protein [Hydrobacter penzbergensis]SDW64785.1 hypothetical protein SAMN05444410_104205 [Hydrobacter penzbergensis]